MLRMHTYSPVTIPVNWQSERCDDNDIRLSILQGKLATSPALTCLACDWPMGYGSLAFDNLPLYYQPAAVVALPDCENESDVASAALYIYDSCVAILYVELLIQESIASVNDLAVSQRINALSQQYLSPVFTQLYEAGGDTVLIAPDQYQFFYDKKAAFCAATPMWTARVLVRSEGLSTDHYADWLKNIDSQSDSILLGSGNHLINDATGFDDAHRMLVLNQFQAALLERIESVLKQSLRTFNAAHFEQSVSREIESSVAVHQQRNDHIEFITIQYSAAQSGVQGVRRGMFEQFVVAWQLEEQEKRILSLSTMVQQRLDRIRASQHSRQNRAIQSLLFFIGSLSLVGLFVDLIGLEQGLEHAHSTGVFDLFALISPENIISLALILVVVFTWYFYRTHK